MRFPLALGLVMAAGSLQAEVARFTLHNPTSSTWSLQNETPLDAAGRYRLRIDASKRGAWTPRTAAETCIGYLGMVAPRSSVTLWVEADGPRPVITLALLPANGRFEAGHWHLLELPATLASPGQQGGLFTIPVAGGSTARRLSLAPPMARPPLTTAQVQGSLTIRNDSGSPWFLAAEALASPCVVRRRDAKNEETVNLVAQGGRVRLEIPPRGLAQVILAEPDSAGAVFELQDHRNRNPFRIMAMVTQGRTRIQQTEPTSSGAEARRVLHFLGDERFYRLSGESWTPAGPAAPPATPVRPKGEP